MAPDSIKGQMRQRGGYTPGQPSLATFKFLDKVGGGSHYLTMDHSFLNISLLSFY